MSQTNSNFPVILVVSLLMFILGIIAVRDPAVAVAALERVAFPISIAGAVLYLIFFLMVFWALLLKPDNSTRLIANSIPCLIVGSGFMLVGMYFRV